MKGSWRGLTAYLGGLSFFAAKSESDFFLLAITGGVFIFPFAIYQYSQGNRFIALAVALLAAWFLLHGIAVVRGRRLLPAAAVFLPTLAVFAFAFYTKAELAVYWGYPAILLFHFILPRWVANLYNATLLAISVPFAYFADGGEVGTRVAVTMFLTIGFANVFSYLIERQRKREAVEEQQTELERDRLALLVHATRAGFTDWDAAGDPEARAMVYSERFKEMLGYPGDADTSGWPNFFDMVHPEDRPGAEAGFRSMLRAKRSPGLQRPTLALDYRLRRTDGNYVWVHALSLVHVDEALRVRRFITSFQDINQFIEQEERLREQSRFQAHVFDSLPIGLAMRNLEGRYVLVNRAWEGFTGRSRFDVIGKTMHETAVKEEADMVVAEDRAAFARGPHAAPVLQDLNALGKRFMLTRTVMTDSKGAPTGILVASVDMTERFAIEEKLAAEQRRFALVVRASNSGILDWDGNERTVYYSDRLKEILGWPADTDTAHMPDYWDQVHPDDREQVEKRFRQHIIERREEKLHPVIQYRLRRRDGSYVWIEAFGSSVRDENGYATRFIASITDISARREAEDALVTEQRRLDLVVRAQQVGIVDWDGNTHVTYYSPRFKEILGHPPDADTSEWPDYFKVLIHPDDRERIVKRWRSFIYGTGPEGPRGEYYAPEEYRLLRADGSYVWVAVSGVAVRDEKNYVVRWIAATTDITERRRQEEALRESVRLREEVERMSRHDLKTPLNSVIAMSRLLRESGKMPAEDADLLGTVERAGYRILNMVNLSLDLFRMESGTYQFHPRAVDLAAGVRRVAADLEGQAASKNVHIQVNSPSSIVARGDELLCYSMFANLIKNAIEAVPEGEVVDVTINNQEDWVVAKVHNAGAVHEAVRERFFQKYVTAGKSAGLGLGAYSARLMARVQEGEITMQSSDAAGTSLVIRLKAAQGNELPAAGGEASKGHALERAGKALPKQRVLVADDDEFNRLVLRRTLPSPPLTLAMAVNGRAALESAERDWPDVVLLDLEMPVMDGYETARRLREMEKAQGRKRCKIVAISSNDEKAIIERALAAGCDEYLVKPAPREALWRILSSQKITQQEEGTAEASDPVTVDLDLKDTLPAFLESRRKTLDEMPGALKKGDRARFKRLAHRLAGSFALYGFRWAAQHCRAIEKDAADGEAGKLLAQVAAVRRHLDAATVRFARRPSEEQV